MPLVKVGQRRLVSLPKPILEAVGLEIGDFVELQVVEGRVVMTPKKLVDATSVQSTQDLSSSSQDTPRA